MTAEEAIQAIQRYRLSIDYSRINNGYYCCWRVKQFNTEDECEVLYEALIQGPYQYTVIAAVEAVITIIEKRGLVHE